MMAENFPLKMDFVVKSFNLNSNGDFFYVYKHALILDLKRNGQNKKLLWPLSASGNFIHYFLMLVRSPASVRDGLIRSGFCEQSAQMSCSLKASCLVFLKL